MLEITTENKLSFSYWRWKFSFSAI